MVWRDEEVLMISRFFCPTPQHRSKEYRSFSVETFRRVTFNLNLFLDDVFEPLSELPTRGRPLPVDASLTEHFAELCAMVGVTPEDLDD